MMRSFITYSDDVVQGPEYDVPFSLQMPVALIMSALYELYVKSILFGPLVTLSTIVATTNKHHTGT